MGTTIEVEIVEKADWDEALHPRDDHGRFAGNGVVQRLGTRGSAEDIRDGKALLAADAAKVAAAVQHSSLDRDAKRMFERGHFTADRDQWIRDASAKTLALQAGLNRSARDGLLRLQGHSQEAIDQAETMMRYYSQGGIRQAEVMPEIEQHLRDNTPVGQAIRGGIAIEEDAYRTWKAARGEAAERAVESARAVLEGNDPYDKFVLLDQHQVDLRYQPPEELYDAVRAQSGREAEFVVYRAGGTGSRRIESWTTNAKGVYAGPDSASDDEKEERSWVPDTAETLDTLLADGWSVLGGLVRPMGYDGEGEVTLVRLPEAPPSKLIRKIPATTDWGDFD